MFDRIKESLSKFTKKGIADKKAIEELIKDIQRSLIQSDVDVKIVIELSNKIKEQALTEKLPPGITRREHVVKIVYDQLVELLGKEKHTLEIKNKKIMLVGLFGSGKTTTTAKLARLYLKRGLSVGLISCDTWRPAAFEQLLQLSKKLDVSVYGDAKEKNPVKIVKTGLEQLKAKNVIIIDTAGRSAIDGELAEEIKDIDKLIKADDKLLVLSGDIGQAAKIQATEFNKLIGLTGIILTKMDSSARGGGAISACYVANVKVKFIGTGEKTDALEIYDPVRFVSRLLGMGDLETLLEKAQEAISPKHIEDMLKGDITLETFYEQIESTKKMGSISKILEMIPGMGNIKIPKDLLDKQEKNMVKWKYMMDSMTKAEKREPKLLDISRIERIAKGSGTTPEDIRELIQNFNKTKKMMKKMKGGKMIKNNPMSKMMKNMKGLPF
ncbi:MAG: signal recognition particle receptor subunit alpha [DPANN group archaeon]|nr:signal recognition particle receptor subunit alpha [DPANN group archaeon]